MLGVLSSSGLQIVTNGLQLYYDASIKRSYPGSGATWQDLSNNLVAATFNNTNYAFTNTAGGYLEVLDFNSSCDLNTSFSLSGLSGLTIQSFFQYYQGQYEGAKIFGGTTIELSSGFGGTGIYFGDDSGKNANTSVSTGVWNFVSGIKDTTNLQMSIRVNDGSRITNTYGSMTSGAISNGFMFCRSKGSGILFRGYIGCVLVYSRALSTTEESQNWNVLRRRFGV